MHKAFKLPNDYQTYNDFLEMRTKCKLLSKKCYKDYIVYTQINLRLDPKQFWNFVKTRDKSFPNIMSYNNISYEDDNSISNMFAKYFNTFYSDTHISDITSHAYLNTYNNQLNIFYIFISL
jgi:hypothetical protein